MEPWSSDGMRKLKLLLTHRCLGLLEAALVALAVLFCACSRPAGEKKPALSEAPRTDQKADAALPKPPSSTASRSKIDDPETLASNARRQAEKVDFQDEA